LRRGRLPSCPVCAAAAQQSVVQRPEKKQRLLFAVVEALFGFRPFFALAARQVRSTADTHSWHLSPQLLAALSRCVVTAGEGGDRSGGAAGALDVMLALLPNRSCLASAPSL